MAADTPDSSESGVSARPDVVDLDVLRAARLETTGDRVIRFGGREWSLVPEVPFELAEAWRDGRRRAALALLLSDPGDVDEFYALRPSNEDWFAILEAFGTSSGKSGAS